MKLESEQARKIMEGCKQIGFQTIDTILTMCNISYYVIRICKKINLYI